MPYLSIIVPVYNVSSYLRDGLDSLIKQDVQDIEIICINDGSTDKSLDILNEYALREKRIKVYSQKNGGVSAARNAGIEKAQGKYIAFFDPDDKVKVSMYSQLLSIAEKENDDIVFCSYEDNINNIKKIEPFTKNKTVDPYELVKNKTNLHSGNNFCFSWRFLFRLDLLNNNKLRFNINILLGEDALFNLEALFLAKRIYYLDMSLYEYCISNPNSLMKTKYKPYLEDGLNLQIEEKKRLIKKYKVDKYTSFSRDMYEDIAKRYTLMLLNNLRNNPNETDKCKGIERILKISMIKEAVKEIGFRNIYSSWKEYIFYLGIKFRFSKLVYKLYFKS